MMSDVALPADGAGAEGGGTIQAGELKAQRHQLRTGAYLIVSCCDRLLEDAMSPDAAPLRDAIGEAMMAGRQIAASVQAAMPAARQSMPVSDLTALFRSIEEPRDRIVRATTRMLRAGDNGELDEWLIADLSTVRSAAMQLLHRDTIQLHTPAPAAITRPLLESLPKTPVRRSMPAIMLPTHTGPARILIAEDSAEPRRLLAEFLKRLGHQADTAENGEIALARLREQHYDIVLTDIEMPRLDGFGLLTAIKASPDTRDIPVIVISGVDDYQTVARCIKGGADEHLTKPFDIVLLEARLNALLERKRLRDAETRYFEQVQRVAAAAAAVEERTYETGELTDIAGRDDELGKLARVFDSMASGVKVREERLSSRVRALQTEISRTQSTPKAFVVPRARSLLSLGEVFADRYEIVEQAGEGGMGTVYRAHDRVLGEDVAIKTVLRQLLSESPMVVERLKNELRLARRLTHRNIVRCHDFGEARGIYYLTMEFVRGTTVRELIDLRGRLTVPATLAIGVQLADALAAAHEQGVIHRDIKPANLLTTEHGVLKVMDFGVARLMEPSESLTAVGFIVGTPEYMAPERLLGTDVEPRSDLYAMGVVLYECLTGRLPIEATSPMALLAAVLTEHIAPVSFHNPDVPQPLSALVARLLAREPAKRPADAGVVAEELRAMA